MRLKSGRSADPHIPPDQPCVRLVGRPQGNRGSTSSGALGGLIGNPQVKREVGHSSQGFVQRLGCIDDLYK